MWIPPRFLSFLAGLFLIGGRCCAEEVRGRIESSSIEVKLVPDKATIMLGEPVFLSFIVTNKTAEDLTVIVGGDYQNGMGRPDTFEVTTHAADGHEVVQPTAGQNMGGISGPERIPVSGTYSFRLFLPHWAKIDRVG